MGYWYYSEGVNFSTTGNPVHGCYHYVYSTQMNTKFYASSSGYTHGVNSKTRSGTIAKGCSDSSRYWTGNVGVSFKSTGGQVIAYPLDTTHQSEVTLSARNYSGQASSVRVFFCNQAFTRDGLSAPCQDDNGNANLALNVYPSFRI